MIQLRFNSLAGTDPGTVGPAPFFRIEGPLLQQGAELQVVGRYADHYWEIANRFVSSYEFAQSVLLHFEGPDGLSRTYGPFQHVRFPNGSCYADRALFAELVDGRAVASGRTVSIGSQWLHRADSTKWSTLVIRPA